MSSSGYQDDQFGRRFLDEILDWINENMEPEDVFQYGKLKKWADNNGFEDKEI